MRSYAERAQILELVAAGVNDCEIARRLGVPRTTVRDIRRWRPPPTALGGDCPRCGRATKRMVLPSERYAELLGLYLGDGWISRLARTYRLRIALDAKYPQIIADAKALLTAGFPGHAVGELSRHGGAMTVLTMYSSHLPCLFPQHGPGKKHERRIALEPWQQAHVDAAPWPFLRGCFRADGCAFINRTGRYSYLSYDFANHSSEILDLWCATCDAVGVEYRRYARSVRVYRRASVALLEEHIGRKF